MDVTPHGPNGTNSTPIPAQGPIPPVSQPPLPVPDTNGASPHQTPAPTPQQKIPSPPPQFQNISTSPPVIKSEEKPIIAQREAREKKESWKKKEAKASTTKPTQDQPTLSTLLPPTRLRPPPYRQEDINAIPRLPTFTSAYTTTVADGRPLEFFRVSDQPFNKKKFRYTPCAAAPEFPQIMYRQISLPPHYARVNWQDMNQYILIDKEGLTVTTEKGYRMARTNVCVREGEWYVEFKIERGGGDQGGHTRIGFVRRESIPPEELRLTLAPLDVPVGFDGYSYGLRDVTGQKVHLSRPRTFMEPFRSGDVIGMHICLPPITKSEEETHKGVFRDRIPIRFRGQLYFEQPDYVASKEMDDLMNPILPPQSQNNPSIPAPRPSFPYIPGSFINVYKNGALQGTAFEDLLAFLPPASQIAGRDLDDGMLGYYPAVSVFHHGIVRLNFGPQFFCPPADLEGRGVRPMCERYEEMAKEDREYDLIDEKEWEQDAARMDTTVGETVAIGAEIKELADDEWT